MGKRGSLGDETGISAMENAQLISLSRQIALQRQMDVVANNMANINTNGFKAENLLIEEYKMPVARDRDFAWNDQILSYTEDWATVHDTTPGAIEQTGKATGNITYSRLKVSAGGALAGTLQQNESATPAAGPLKLVEPPASTEPRRVFGE